VTPTVVFAIVAVVAAAEFVAGAVRAGPPPIPLRTVPDATRERAARTT